MKLALIGLMQSGKSTLLSAVSGKSFDGQATMAIHEEVVPVPDERLEWLTEIYQPRKTVHATIDCLDLPGLSFVDESGRSAARRLFNQVRTVDMFAMVINGFSSGGNFAGGLADLKTEMLLADLELVTTRIERLEKQVHKPSKTQARDKEELAIQLKLQEAIESEKPIRSAIANDKELGIIKSLGFLTLKPQLIVINVSEDKLGQEIDVSSIAGEDTSVICLSASLESELAQLDEKSRAEFMSDYGLTEPAAKRFIQECYASLGLISFLTVGKDEVRAWPIAKGTTAHEAAGKIHSDIQRGFIRAETIAYDDMKQYGSEKECKAAGRTRLEGKTYIVNDGDLISFRFNV